MLVVLFANAKIICADTLVERDLNTAKLSKYIYKGPSSVYDLSNTPYIYIYIYYRAKFAVWSDDGMPRRVQMQFRISVHGVGGAYSQYHFFDLTPLPVTP